MKSNRGVKILLNTSLILAYFVITSSLFFVQKNEALAQTVQQTVRDSNEIKLNVPYFRQQYLNSCEAASLRMVLGFYGVQLDDMQILQRIGYRPRAKDVVKNEWDDPQEQFVGFVDNTNGYGVYGLPVSYAAASFGRRVEYRVSITPQFLAKEIASGHPVIVWGSTSVTAPAYTWNLPNGGMARAFKGEHARVVVGLRGDVNDPIGFYIHDSLNGLQFQYWSTEDLMKNIYSVPGVTNQAVVVR